MTRPQSLRRPARTDRRPPARTAQGLGHVVAALVVSGVISLGVVKVRNWGGVLQLTTHGVALRVSIYWSQGIPKPSFLHDKCKSAGS